MRRLFLVCEWCCTSWEDTCCLQDVWIHHKDFCSALVCFHGLVPNLEIQAQYLQTVLGSFSSFMFPVAKITWKNRVMVWIWIIASLKEELRYERCAQVCLLSAQITDLLIKLCSPMPEEQQNPLILLYYFWPTFPSTFQYLLCNGTNKCTFLFGLTELSQLQLCFGRSAHSSGSVFEEQNWSSVYRMALVSIFTGVLLSGRAAQNCGWNYVQF